MLQMKSVHNNKAVDSFVANTAKSAANLLQTCAPALFLPLSHHCCSSFPSPLPRLAWVAAHCRMRERLPRAAQARGALNESAPVA